MMNPTKFDHRILIIDDMKQMLDCLDKILKNIGFKNVRSFTDSEEALTEILEATKNNNSYDLVISDIKMPRLNGLQLLDKIQKTDMKTTFVIMSTSNESQTVLAAVRSGAKDYIIKPFEVDVIKEKIFRIFDLKE